MNCKREEDLTCDNIGKPINIFNFIAIICFRIVEEYSRLSKHTNELRQTQEMSSGGQETCYFSPIMKLA